MDSDEERLILVDEKDQELGTEGKLTAHRKGILHRAFSAYVFDSKGRIMMQKRAASKYHSGGLWTCTCCGHPRPGEDVHAAVRRRLQEEMGFMCELTEIPSITYRAELGGGMTEHEFLHVYVGTYDGVPTPNPEEADGYAWMTLAELEADMTENPSHYTEWLKLCWPQIKENLPKR
jgi:isopentenyl-diphosphate delta-isomerase